MNHTIDFLIGNINAIEYHSRKYTNYYEEGRNKENQLLELELFVFHREQLKKYLIDVVIDDGVINIPNISTISGVISTKKFIEHLYTSNNGLYLAYVEDGNSTITLYSRNFVGQSFTKLYEIVYEPDDGGSINYTEVFIDDDGRLMVKERSDYVIYYEGKIIKKSNKNFLYTPEPEYGISMEFISHMMYKRDYSALNIEYPVPDMYRHEVKDNKYRLVQNLDNKVKEAYPKEFAKIIFGNCSHTIYSARENGCIKIGNTHYYFNMEDIVFSSDICAICVIVKDLTNNGPVKICNFPKIIIEGKEYNLGDIRIKESVIRFDIINYYYNSIETYEIDLYNLYSAKMYDVENIKTDNFPELKVPECEKIFEGSLCKYPIYIINQSVVYIKDCNRKNLFIESGNKTYCSKIIEDSDKNQILSEIFEGKGFLEVITYDGQGGDITFHHIPTIILRYIR